MVHSLAGSMALWLAVTFLLLGAAHAQDDFLYGTFPDGFEWGSATASYQIEGGWDANGKGENIWDHMVHTDPGSIVDGSNGDVAADSYHLYKEDVRILKETGVNFYRFSLSWSRLLPTGRVEEVNQDGVDYYNNLINELLDNNIKPMVTLYHWDLPQPLEEIGGWMSDEIVDLFGFYSNFTYVTFGDRVKNWITLNEPWVQSQQGYGTGQNAPRVIGNGQTSYIAAHNLIKAHARAWHIYNETYRAEQGGIIGITIDSGWVEPKSSNSDEDIEAAERAMQFKLGWFAHPIFSAEGDYPEVMKEYIARHTFDEGWIPSRLPIFDATWKKYILGTSDFFGLNHYTTSLAEYGMPEQTPSWERDQEVFFSVDPAWPESAAGWLKVVPWGFRKVLNWIKNEYNNPRVYVTENGFADRGDVSDPERVEYYRSYINEMMKAVNLDGCNVVGYAAWSIIDNFEWTSGYEVRFGLYNVDFTDPARPRTQKDSARLFTQIIQDNGFPAPFTRNSSIPV